jgi:hypothetical protein
VTIDSSSLHDNRPQDITWQQTAPHQVTAWLFWLQSVLRLVLVRTDRQTDRQTAVQVYTVTAVVYRMSRQYIYIYIVSLFPWILIYIFSQLGTHCSLQSKQKGERWVGVWIYVQQNNSEVRWVICFLAVRPTGALRSHFFLRSDRLEHCGHTSSCGQTDCSTAVTLLLVLVHSWRYVVVIIIVASFLLCETYLCIYVESVCMCIGLA